MEFKDFEDLGCELYGNAFRLMDDNIFIDGFWFIGHNWDTGLTRIIPYGFDKIIDDYVACGSEMTMFVSDRNGIQRLIDIARERISMLSAGDEKICENIR